MLIKKGNSGIMASGKELNDDAYTCASLDYSFGTLLRITNLQNNKSVVCEVTDRGPARKLYRQGQIIDLTKAAFSILAPLSQGLFPCKYENSF